MKQLQLHELYVSHKFVQLCETTHAGDLCDNTGLVLVYLPSGAMTLACIPKPSPVLPFKEFCIY